MATELTFDAWDYTIMVLMVLISMGIGLFYRFTGGRQQTTQEYLLADRNMSFIPVSFSLMASFMSAITLLGVSSENYMYGTQFVIINIAYGISTPIAAYLYLPVFFKLQRVSAYEYLGLRFGKRIRLIASLAYTLQMVMYIGIVIYAPAITLEAVTGLSKTFSILLIGLVCTFYSTVGGMKAVLVTDVFQSVLMFAAVYSIIIYAAVVNGGISAIWSIAEDRGRIEFLNFSLDPTERHTWWSLIIGGMVTYLSLYAVNQTQVQRLLTVKDLKTSQKCLWWNWPILTLLSLSTSFSGLAIFAKYYNCDPMVDNKISSVDQLMPYYVIDTMGGIPGLAGLFIAGIFSASLSTISAGCNSLAAVTLQDYIKPLYKIIKKQALPEKGLAVWTKVVACTYGLACLAIAFLAQYLGGVLQSALTIFSVVGGPLFGVFTLGMFTLGANETGSLIGMLSGLSLSLWIGFGGPKPPPSYLNRYVDGCTDISTHSTTILLSSNRNATVLDNNGYFYLYRISYMWSGVLGFLCTLIVGYLTSVILRKISPRIFGNVWEIRNKNRIHTISAGNLPNPDLFSPIIARGIRKRNDKLLNRYNFQVLSHMII
ncbi:putative sodium-dependent multivitamin transporter [Arctopsyche grandis]|uniref:putative sodium-dependent multivitamin transporter n=1 Tax=Arctopsyche grandis TaxID=121162 RepID=UPI00406D7D6F